MHASLNYRKSPSDPIQTRIARLKSRALFSTPKTVSEPVRISPPSPEQFKATLATEKRILKKFHDFLVSEFSKGRLPQTVLKISPTELRGYLGNPEKLQKHFPEFGEEKLWDKIKKFSTDFWTNHTDAGQNINAGQSLTGAPAGKGKLVSGGYDSQKLETVSVYDMAAAVESGNIREMGNLFRVRPEGSGPDIFDHEDNSDSE